MEQNRNTETDLGMYQNIVCDQSGTTTQSGKDWSKDLNMRGKSYLDLGLNLDKP